MYVHTYIHNLQHEVVANLDVFYLWTDSACHSFSVTMSRISTRGVALLQNFVLEYLKIDHPKSYAVFGYVKM